MTRDTHTTGSARQPGRRPLRPDAGRPSLFADFDQESVEDIDPQRIRLLSTLESQRGVRRRPQAGRLPTGRAHPWLTRALMAAMGLGMLVMLLSFIQLLRRPPAPPPAVQTASLQAPANVSTTARLAGGSATDAAEIIDLSPPAGGVTRDAMLAQAPAESSANSVHPGSSPVSAAPQNPPPSPPTKSAAPSNTEPERLAKSAKPGAQRTSTHGSASTNANTKREPVTSQEDVALVEAMLAHAGPRKAPPSPTLALQQCGTGTSAQTSVCRAKVCVQHPSLPACHTP
ncbi:hypothetical protein [Aquabacterium parvum]|uniref:hypothetical protein n=1 Tax=Aquabacterium parvum TaxID=70584 RepID=UPI000718DA5C|nr:hypothetical protein [Aquabacterium parvum]MBU0917441.1 hypothetical protein [Gammaproteobacteria bacterium]